MVPVEHMRRSRAAGRSINPICARASSEGWYRPLTYPSRQRSSQHYVPCFITPEGGTGGGRAAVWTLAGRMPELAGRPELSGADAGLWGGVCADRAACPSRGVLARRGIPARNGLELGMEGKGPASHQRSLSPQ